MYKNKYLKYKNKYLKLQNKVNLYTIGGGTENITTYTELFTKDIKLILNNIKPDTTIITLESVNNIYTKVNDALKKRLWSIDRLKKNDKIIDYILIESINKKINLQDYKNLRTSTASNDIAFKTAIDTICNDETNETNESLIYDNIFNEDTIKKIIKNKIFINILSQYYITINNCFIDYIKTNLNTIYNDTILGDNPIYDISDKNIIYYITINTYKGKLHNNNNNILNDIITKFNDTISNTNYRIISSNTVHKKDSELDEATARDYYFNDNIYIDTIVHIMNNITHTPQYIKYIEYINIIINHVYNIICVNNDLDYTYISNIFTMKYDDNTINYIYVDLDDPDITSHFIKNHIKIHKYILNMINKKVCTDLYKSICKKYFNIFKDTTNLNILKYIYMKIFNPTKSINKPSDFSYLGDIIKDIDCVNQISKPINTDIDKLKNLFNQINIEFTNFYTNNYIRN